MTDSLFHADSTRNRSETRSNSNQHSRRGSSSFNPSVRSWVLSNQQNPPPPPPEHGTTSLRASRPLPDHTYHTNGVPSQGHLPHPPLQVMNPTDSEDNIYYPGADQPRLGYFPDNPEERQRNLSRAPRVLTRVPQEETRNASLMGGLVRGLKRVLRNRPSTDKRRPAFIAEEGESTEAVTTLPRYRSNPSTPIVGASTVAYVQAAEMPTPELHYDRLPTDALRSVRPRHPSYRVMPPSTDGLVEEQTAQIYDLLPPEPPTFRETPSPTPPPEADQATTLYYDNPADATSTSFNGQPQSQSLRISYISHHTPNTRAATLNPPTPQHIPSQIPSQIPSDIQENPNSIQSPISPVLARPPLSNDYRKMSLNSHDVTSRADTNSASYSMEPSFSSELSPVKRFLHILHSLPWVANERITSDYSPGKGAEKDLPKKKAMISWYRRAEDSHGNTAAVDLLSTGSPRSEGASSSNATPVASPKLEPRRVRRSHSHLHSQRHQHGHSRHQRHQRQHHHRHGHGRRNQRRRTATTVETDDDDVVHHVHGSSPVLPPVYPPQYNYAYQYPFPPPTAPRGPRSRPSPTYHGGYVPFQPMPPTPPPAQMPVTSPVYVLAPNGHSHENVLRDGYPVQGQPMYVLPNGYRHNNHSRSPPPNMDGTP